jgi:putative addiction module component (TIGR02574 family)
VDDRVVLAHEIWDSVAADVERAPLTEPQRRELERRLADHQANPDDVVPWEQIKAEALARFGR